MRALITSVNYADFLALSLPYNKHHFEEILVVTSKTDTATRAVVESMGCKDITWLATDAFFEDGASLNKWKALEEGLDELGREGWLCLLDADILWPKVVHLELQPGNLYAPLRRMMTALPLPFTARNIPGELQWDNYPVHSNINEWAGYSQVFHASDSVLGEPPWHDLLWKHAGCADTDFQNRWPTSRKLRPKWQCLHLGLSGVNWMGRATPYLDGSVDREGRARMQATQDMKRQRRFNRAYDRDRIKPE